MAEHEFLAEGIIKCSRIEEKKFEGMSVVRGLSTTVNIEGSQCQPDASLYRKLPNAVQDHLLYKRVPAIVFEANLMSSLERAKIKSATYVLRGSVRLCVLADIKIDKQTGVPKTITIYMFRGIDTAIKPIFLKSSDVKEHLNEVRKDGETFYTYYKKDARIAKVRVKPIKIPVLYQSVSFTRLSILTKL
jgi:hypothetical protein